MIFIYIGLPLAVAAVLPLAGKASRRVLPDILSNAVLAGLLAYAVTGPRRSWSTRPIVQQVRWFGGRQHPDRPGRLQPVHADGDPTGQPVRRPLFHQLHGALRRQGQLLRPSAGDGRGNERPRSFPGSFQRLSVPRSRGRGLLRPGRLRPGSRGARSLIQIPHALGRGLGGRLVGGHRPLRHDRSPGLRRRGRGSPAIGGQGRRRRRRRPVSHGLRAEGGPDPLSCLASRRPPFGPGPHFGHSFGPADQSLGRLRHHPDLLSRHRPDPRPVPGADVAGGRFGRRRRLPGSRPKGHEADAGLFLHQPGRIRRSRPRAGNASRRGRRPLPSLQPRHRQEPPVLHQRLGSTGDRDAEPGRDGRAGQTDALDGRDQPRRLALDRRRSPAGGFWSKLVIIMALVQARGMVPGRDRGP